MYIEGDLVRGSGALPAEHHQLLHRLPGGGGPLCGRHRHALLRLHHGGWWVVVPNSTYLLSVLCSGHAYFKITRKFRIYLQLES